VIKIELSIEFKPKNKAALYTIDVLKEALATLLKQKNIEFYSISIAHETLETNITILEAQEGETE